MKAIKFTLVSVLWLVGNLVLAAPGDALNACVKSGSGAGASLSRDIIGANLLFIYENDDMRAKPEYARLLKSVGVGALRFPGGTVADNYHWETGEIVRPDRFPFRQSNSNDLNFDEFMAVAKPLGAEPSIVLNYLSWVEKQQFEDGIKEAVNWLKYANVEKKFGIKYWEMGNEVYFNASTTHINVPARTYAKDYKTMRKALRAVDSSILLGAAMPQKMHFKTKGDKGEWWNAFLDEIGDDLDYVVLHDYPRLTNQDYIEEGTSFPELLANARAKMLAKLGRTVPIHVTEWNIAHWKKKNKPDFVKKNSAWHGLFIAETLLDFAVNDVRYATFWPARINNNIGLFAYPNLEYMVGGEVFKLLAPLQDQTFAYDCKDQGLRVARLSGANGAGGLIVINKGSDKELDVAPILDGKASTIMKLSTLTAENGKYIVKEFAGKSLKSQALKNGTTFATPSPGMFVMELGK
jgi:hypothetical protein